MSLPGSTASIRMTEVVNLSRISHVHTAEVVNGDLAEARKSCTWEVKLRRLRECKHRSIQVACDVMDIPGLLELLAGGHGHVIPGSLYF
jgi:hypothetical protein